MREKYWYKENIPYNTIKTTNTSSSTVSDNSKADSLKSGCDDKGFIVRSRNQLNSNFNAMPEESSSMPSSSFLPPNACAIDKRTKEEYNIQDHDYFTIYYNDANSLLNAFADELINKGNAKPLAIQHRNQVQLIWKSVSLNMEMFPTHPFSNLHLLKHRYHVPMFKMMGKEAGVQSGTLRARYTSLNLFTQFIRRNQIFAGMSRQILHLLDYCISDFNKELNPFIKQRKVDVRQHKVRYLLLPSHFIDYGRSRHVQKLVNVANKEKKEHFSKSFAIQFRDYLITTMTITNGLRASNIINLSLKDILEAKTVKGYEGHKVITNSNYKTSTIYGEKFIVLPDVTVKHSLFYINTLRAKLNKQADKSKRLFLPNSMSSVEFTATNVSSALTASFKEANIFKSFDHRRVSCTRIRCGIATYACNDGEMDVRFFAHHFMKNREDTTSIHYNLLSNQRHALNIAMRLYDKFSGNEGKSITVDNDDELAKEIKESSNVNYTKVTDWLTKNTEIEKAEMEEFKKMLQELNIQNKETFYSKVVEPNLKTLQHLALLLLYFVNCSVF